MIKYNYKKAGAIWDRLINITYDMSDYLDYGTRQAERRYFLRGLTRGDRETVNIYLDYITDYITEFSDTKFLKDKDRETLERIALQIVLFTNEDNC